MYKIHLSKRISSFVLLLAFGIGLALPGHAQQYLGTISGSVSDTTGAKVVGAEVSATDTSTLRLQRGDQ